jgi:hypothetical protein
MNAGGNVPLLSNELQVIAINVDSGFLDEGEQVGNIFSLQT